MRNHYLPCNPETVHWGFLAAALPNVLVISPGDEVRIDTLSGGASRLPRDRSRHRVLAEHESVIAACSPRLGPHILTGPIGVQGAEPGDVLRVQILGAELRQNWGWNEIVRDGGILPELESDSEVVTLPIDLPTATIHLPWGPRAAAAPFFGVMAVKPPADYGEVTSLIPGVFGGNMDIRELKPGAELCFPVHSAGAGFSVGDGHALQGDGEVVGTAVETALTGSFKFELDKRAAQVRFPYARMADRLLTLAVDEDLARAAKEAVSQAVRLLGLHFGLSASEAYRHCSLLGDLSISQLVNVKKGVHFSVRVDGLVAVNQT